MAGTNPRPPPGSMAPEDAPAQPLLGGLPRYVLTKLAGAALSIVAVIVMAFFLFRLLPGDPVLGYTRARGGPTTPEQLDLLRRQLGLDKPLSEQFVDFIVNTARLDLGTSYEYRRPVADLIGERLGPTVLLVGTALMIAVAVGLWQGSRAAWRHNSRFDRFSVGTSLTFWSVPTFWLGIILLMVFSAGIGPIPGMLPARGLEDIDAPGGILYPLHVAHHMVLPVITIVGVVYAQYLLVMRSSLLDEIGNDYLTTARAKGLMDADVRRHHAVPNALLPTVTLIFMNVGFIVNGAITTETVFSWPGLGLLFYKAIQGPDFAVMQGCFVVLAVAVIIMNMLADFVYHLLDPRVRRA